jgi:regulator of protease activity HflC (stomatin/prohibitin superfamily)
MGWFIILGFAIIFVIGGVVAASIGYKVEGIGSIIVTVMLFIGITVLASYHTVENGHIGIVKEFGSLVGTTGEGLVSTAPWQTLDEVSVQNELKTYDMTGNNSAVSSDSQAVFLIAQVNYSLNRERATQLYRETGGHFVERILDPAVFQNTKQVTAAYKAIDFAKNRGEIRQKIEQAVSSEVERHGLTIINVSLKNVDFTDALSRAIEETVEAEQQAAREQAKVEISKAQAEQAVAVAQGEANATRTRAKGDRDAAFLRRQQLTPLLVQWEAIQKLNPKVSIIYCPVGQVCLPNTTPVVPAPDGEQP